MIGGIFNYRIACSCSSLVVVQCKGRGDGAKYCYQQTWEKCVNMAKPKQGAGCFLSLLGPVLASHRSILLAVCWPGPTANLRTYLLTGKKVALATRGFLRSALTRLATRRFAARFLPLGGLFRKPLGPG